MCSICGMFGSDCETVERMNAIMRRRGPDQNGTVYFDKVSLGHNRLSVIDLENGKQPMTLSYRENRYTIVYNGEIYNQKELLQELAEHEIYPSTRSDTETVLWSYILWGEECPVKLNGIFAFAVYDEGKDHLFLCRDRLGVKPLYYTYVGNTFVFSSELKGLLTVLGVEPEVDREGIWELLFLAPVTLPESGTFRGIKKLLPGQRAIITRQGMSKSAYWTLDAKPFTQTKKQAYETVRSLMTDAVERQMISDVPICTLLSGGLDSSVITALAAKEQAVKGRRLSSYSFQYADNQTNFKQSLFQPESDDAYASWLGEWLHTNHTVLTASTRDVFEALPLAVEARDLPGQADIDSSLLYYCGRIKETHTVVLSGECSDEIFGGYPWFYRPEMLQRNFFPWIHDPTVRASLFREEFARSGEGYEYISGHYRDFTSSISRLEEDTDSMYRSRVATQLSVWYFMQSLLERKDRMSMFHAVEVRVPFADHRILEYVYNVPWSIKFESRVEKSLLRNAMTGLLPDRILFRKKSPYPKTHDPLYEQLTRTALLTILEDKNSRLHEIVNPKKVKELLNGGDVTWFGQLMARPQLYAWLIQLEYWLKSYHVRFAV